MISSRVEKKKRDKQELQIKSYRVKSRCEKDRNVSKNKQMLRMRKKMKSGEWTQKEI